MVVLLLSTYEEDEYAPRAAECGAAAYIPKAVFGPGPARSRLGDGVGILDGLSRHRPRTLSSDMSMK